MTDERIDADFEGVGVAEVAAADEGGKAVERDLCGAEGAGEEEALVFVFEAVGRSGTDHGGCV